MYYIYMLRCSDNSIYTGITVNVEKRMQEHFNKTEKCAKYTYSHDAKKLECVWQTSTKSLACKLEYYIKMLKKNEKELLIKDDKLLGALLKDKVPIDEYEKVAMS